MTGECEKNTKFDVKYAIQQKAREIEIGKDLNTRKK